MSDTKASEVENEQEEHSLTISQHSSPSQSDQEANNLHKQSTSPNGSTLSGAHLFIPIKSHQDKEIANGPQSATQKGLPFLNSECTKLCMKRHEQFLPVDHKPLLRPCGSHFVRFFLKLLKLPHFVNSDPHSFCYSLTTMHV